MLMYVCTAGMHAQTTFGCKAINHEDAKPSNIGRF